MYSHVLVGTDGSETATRAVEAAARLAQTYHARLTIVHAFAPQPIPTRDPRAEEFWWRMSSGVVADEVVKAAERRAQEVAGPTLDIATLHAPGKPVEVMVNAVSDIKPDAVVVGNADVRRRRLHRSIGHALSRKVRSDVVVVDTSRAA